MIAELTPREVVTLAAESIRHGDQPPRAMRNRLWEVIPDPHQPNVIATLQAHRVSISNAFMVVDWMRARSGP